MIIPHLLFAKHYADHFTLINAGNNPKKWVLGYFYIIDQKIKAERD